MVAMVRALPLCALLLVASSMMLSSLVFAQVPEFIYPTKGQAFDHNDTFKLKVKPIAKAEVYSWTFLQNATVVQERTTGNAFWLSSEAPARSMFVPGRAIAVQARAFVAGNWTEPATITISVRGAEPIQQPVKAAQPTAVNPPPARPVFDYPKDGQQLDYKGSFDFRVKPIANAKSYDWTISQNGKIVAERNTGNEFYLVPGTAEHSKIVPGRVEVRVLARLPEKWTDPTIITLSAVDPKSVEAAQFPSPALATAGWVSFFLVVVALLIYGVIRLSRPAAPPHTPQTAGGGMALFLQHDRRGFFARYELPPADEALIRNSPIANRVVWSDPMRDSQQRVLSRVLTFPLAVPVGILLFLPLWPLFSVLGSLGFLLLAIAPWLGMYLATKFVWRPFYHQLREAILVKDLLTGRTVRDRQGNLVEKEHFIRQHAVMVRDDLEAMKSRGGASGTERIAL